MHTLPKVELIFNGPSYEPVRDNARLTDQLSRIWHLMKDSQFRTLGQIATATGDPESSISAQLRHLRKKRFGSHVIERSYIGNGLHIYKLIPNIDPPEPQIEIATRDMVQTNLFSDMT